ncbi:uncharacterized protein MKK02DRAFT_37170 [Dioszegia hungarica]|uniref:Ubiquitinyl hydrolase 1 n=1 Tax=Dioszegia hungarica TaxID=4972 RepID=A0AA38HCL6_9TREE|nr:uncharacterized protein MKK02DRAFT_37170 [Dioszegia hungarica]KAI9636491.1 hypothetical protein MKK02DRAFT_37170 [Dioszegia hungarica]
MASRIDTSLCEHLGSLLAPASSGRSAAEQRYSQVILSSAKRRKISPPECSSCKTVSQRTWACLTCPFHGCHLTKDCMRAHWNESGCKFAVEPLSGGVFCSQCDDMVYSDRMEQAARSIRLKVEEEADTSQDQTSAGIKRRAPYSAWSGSNTITAPSAPCRGLRPLLNLSQTCFLSAILQAFIHNPLLKSYFLSEKHNRHICASSRGLLVGKPSGGEERDKGCMCCEMDRAFEEFHREDASPFGPITMLYAMWHASGELEGHGQQDAHSFFLAALDQIHAHAKGQLSSCNCIAHQTFSGALLSSVTCSSCRKKSSTVDPILDIQLDFPSHATETISLASLLRRFCAEESLGEGKGYDCSDCGAGQSATRRLVLKKLPPVLSFQLKRFAHNATSTKIETPVRFPSHLDMRPFVDPAPDLPDELYQYHLFAVVTHEGKLDNGHYWADVLSEGEWWHCDDDKVTPTTLKDVLGQKAYMLFYVKRTLAYASVARVAVPVNSAVGGKGVAQKGLQAEKMGGKGGHPIKGMAV